MRRKVRRGQVAVSAVRRLHRDEGGQSLAIILALVTILFLMGSALATHASVALRSTVANEDQGGDLHAADAGAELGMWWQRNGNITKPPDITVNNLTVDTTVAVNGTVLCATPTPTRLTGFETGAVSANGGGLFLPTIGTGVTADNGVARTGGWSLDVTDALNSTAHSARIAAVGTTGVFRLYLRFVTLPAGNVTELLTGDAAGGNDLRLGYQSSSQKLTLGFGAVTTPAASTVTAGTWYQLDLRFTANTNPRTAEWQIDGVTQTPPAPGAATASTVAALRFGSTRAADIYHVNFDDVLISMTLGDYPIGAGAIEALRPVAMGTTNIPASFTDDDTTAIDPTTWTRLNDDPMTSTTRYVIQVTANNTRYIGLTMADTSATCIVGVSGLVAYRAATATTDNGKTSFFDGATERIIYSGDMSETTLFYKSTIVAPAVGPWTTAAVNGLEARIGYSSDVNPTPFWHSLLLEVATAPPAVAGTVTVSSTAGNSTVTTTYTDVGNASPTDLTWSTTR